MKQNFGWGNALRVMSPTGIGKRAWIMRVPTRWQWLQVFGACVILVLCASLVWKSVPHARSWFDARWQATSLIKASQRAVPPTQSDMHGYLVAWIQTHSRKPLRSEFAQMIVQEVFANSVRNGVDPFLVLAVMRVESNFDYTARSSAGAIGLMQVIPHWHNEKLAQPQHVFDPRQNIRVGTEVLAEYRDWHNGDMRKALLQYNGSLHIPGAGYASKVQAARQELVTWLELQFVMQRKEKESVRIR